MSQSKETSIMKKLTQLRDRFPSIVVTSVFITMSVVTMIAIFMASIVSLGACFFAGGVAYLFTKKSNQQQEKAESTRESKEEDKPAVAV
ncbi:hypothetical protein [Algicola sagamiensis]|uniref:hypothetical protein n=1 Tax=Algicola sagamiensis TaxID=163869 RepID=UPI00037D1BCE|nr:hypothetical protein [Algicola sagamiensis]